MPPVAVAAPAKKPPATGPGCKPAVAVVLNGTLTGTPGPSATSFTMTVTAANKHGRNLVGKTVTIKIDANSKIRRQGAKTIGALLNMDRVNVLLRVCKGGLPLGTSPAQPAIRVVAHPAKS